MRALFDVNVLIALFDPAHVHHDRAHDWLEEHQGLGWATCPITQIGCIRILSQAKYPNAIPVAEAMRRLKRAISAPQHAFWADEVSVLDPKYFREDRILSSRTVTDLYLLALAVRNDGRLITFDQGIAFKSIAQAKAKHLVVL